MLIAAVYIKKSLSLVFTKIIISADNTVLPGELKSALELH
jgi:hypothetical protein